MTTHRLIARAVHACLALSTCATATVAHAQAAPPAQSDRARDLSLQFAVPSSPAFNLVGVDKSAILRPVAFHELSTVAGAFTSPTGGFSLPRELGLEFAPFFTARARTLSLAEYQRRPLLYKLRLSAALKRGADTLGASALAFGVRLSILDRNDPRLDRSLVAQLTTLTTAINAVCARVDGPPAPDAVSGIVKDCSDPRGDIPRLTAQLRAIDSAASPDTHKLLRDSLARATAKSAAAKRPLAALAASVDSLKRSWVDQSWNRPSLEIAFAASANTKDSLGRDPKLDVMAAWLSGAFPVGNWGQLIVGATGRNARDALAAPRRWAGGFGAGLYLGGNDFKAFAESRGTWQRDARTIAEFTAGSELKLYGGLWGVGSLGWSTDAQSGRGRLISRLTVRSSLPQLTGARTAVATAAK